MKNQYKFYKKYARIVINDDIREGLNIEELEE